MNQEGNVRRLRALPFLMALPEGGAFLMERKDGREYQFDRSQS